jgi:hypothetical protein
MKKYHQPISDQLADIFLLEKDIEVPCSMWSVECTLCDFMQIPLLLIKLESNISHINSGMSMNLPLEFVIGNLRNKKGING